jgi:hypothetical protein
MNKKDLSERDMCTKFITPPSRGWHQQGVTHTSLAKLWNYK